MFNWWMLSREREELGNEGAQWIAQFCIFLKRTGKPNLFSELVYPPTPLHSSFPGANQQKEGIVEIMSVEGNAQSTAFHRAP